MSILPRALARLLPATRTGRVIGAVVGVGAGIGAGYVGSNLAQKSTTTAGASSSLRYPPDLNDAVAHIKFDFFAYSVRATNIGHTLLGGLLPTMAVAGNITLPIPNNLKDNTGVFIEEAEILPSNLDNQLVNLASTRRGNIDARVLGIAIVGNAALTLAKTTLGLSMNPYTSVLFKHPKFRTHSFTWKLAPQSELESNTIKEIIKTFKAKMLPARAPGGLFFSYPFLVLPKFSPDNSEDFLYEFKHCFITDIAINYAGGGIPSFYKNHAPTVVDITIYLSEIAWQMSEDFQKGPRPQDVSALNEYYTTQ